MKRLTLSTAALATILALPAMANDYDESVSGDLSDDHLAPDTLVLEFGSNVLTSTQQGDSFGRDIDYVTIVVPVGMELTAMMVTGYVADPGNLAFLGVQAGTPFTVDANNAKASDLLGGAVFGGFDVGFDILPGVGSLGGATGFTPPLPAGSYTLWLNQTGDPSTVSLDLVVGGSTLNGNYCAANVNSTGSAASISAFGSLIVGDNELTLVAQDVPVGTPGLFFFGQMPANLPFGEGLRCVGGSIARIQPETFGSSTGQVTRTLDLTTSPAAGVIVSGVTQYFQYWYRDPSGGPSGFNTTNGVSVSFL